MAKVLITGATGFVGRHLVPVLAGRGHVLVTAGRRRGGGGAAFFPVGAIDGKTDWVPALAGVDAVVHLAGVAHRPDAAAAAYFAVNDTGTGRLVAASAAAGVKAFVFLGSIAAREAVDAYGVSKRAGEDHVRRLAGTGIVLRPPLVYGFDAPGNWAKLQRLAATGLPLPFASVKNRRSLCAVGNLCEAIAVALDAALAGRGGGTYEIADAGQVALPSVLAWLRAGMGRPPRLLPLPPSVMRFAARAAGRARLAETLLGDLSVDPAPFTRAFGWRPPEATRAAVEASGRLYAAQREEISRTSYDSEAP